MTATDFELRDNGVPQVLTSTSAEAVPVDATLVLDTSASVTEDRFKGLVHDIKAIARLLQPADRVRLVTFASDVEDVFGLQPAIGSLPVERMNVGGVTSFYDALFAALMLSPMAERPQLVFAVSDGIDTASYIDPRRLVALAGYSSAAMYLTLVPTADRLKAFPTAEELRAIPSIPHLAAVREAVAATGGVIQTAVDKSLPDLFEAALRDFRTSYVLRYVPEGVQATGWHDITVSVPRRPNLIVRARKGYERW